MKPHTAFDKNPSLATNHLSDLFFEYLPEEDKPILFNGGWCFQAARGIEALVMLLRNDRASWLPQDTDYGSPPLEPEHGNGLFSALAALSTALRLQFDRWHGDQMNAREEAGAEQPVLSRAVWQQMLIVLRAYLHQWPQGDTREHMLKLFSPWLTLAEKAEPHQLGSLAQWQTINRGLQQLLHALNHISMPVQRATELMALLQPLRLHGMHLQSQLEKHKG